MARGKAITPKMRDEIEALLGANVPHSEIADRYDLTPLTVKKIGHMLNQLKKSNSTSYARSRNDD